MPRKITTKTEEIAQEGKAKKRSIILANAVWTILFLAALSAAGYFYYQNKNAGALNQEEEKKELVEELSQYLDLPTNEEPTLATVTDREKLADQEFFLKAENGDKVLIYSQAGKAILYRPSTKKIIDMTTTQVTQTGQADQSQQAPEAAPAIVRVAILNGSADSSLAASIENQLKTIAPNAAVVTKSDAKKKDYTTTQVIAVNSAASDAAATIAGGLNGTVGELPEGETAPADADVVVIIGAPAEENTEEN